MRVAQAYFDVLLAENNVTLAAAQKAAFAEQLAQAKRNFEVGTATITDANDAQARHDLAVSQEIAAQNDLEIKKQALRQIIGKLAAGTRQRFGTRFAPALPAPNNMDSVGRSGERIEPAGQNRAGHARHREPGRRQEPRRTSADARRGRNLRGHRPGRRASRAASASTAPPNTSGCSSRCRSIRADSSIRR